MAFESLTDKLQNVFKNLRSKGRLTEQDVTPGTFKTAFSTLLLQAAQDIPVTVY